MIAKFVIRVSNKQINKQTVEKPVDFIGRFNKFFLTIKSAIRNPAPPASGNPFDSVAPLPRQYAPQRLSAPQQRPLAHRHQSITPQTRYYQPQPNYRAPSAANAYSQTKSRPYTRQAGPPLVTKHFYIHAAPEEPEENHAPRYVQVGQPRKNYKSYYPL